MKTSMILSDEEIKLIIDFRKTKKDLINFYSEEFLRKSLPTTGIMETEWSNGRRSGIVECYEALHQLKGDDK